MKGFIREWLTESWSAFTHYLIWGSTVALCYALPLILPN